MYDLDPQRPALRLSDLADTAEARTRDRMLEWMQNPDTRAAVHAPARTAPSVEDATKALTVAEHEMEQAIQRWSAAYVDWTAMRAQAQPVAASRPVPDGMMRYEPAPMVYRVDGRVERL